MCISPIRIRHPTKKCFIDVPCGKCLECAQKKINDWSFRMISEMKDKNAYFFTLTYNDENLPYKHFDFNNQYVCITRGKETKLKDGVFAIRTDKVLQYHENCISAPFYSLPCFYKPDVQVFIHALRDDLRRKGIKVKLKYFIASEYGETSLRPHMHGIIFGYPFNLSDFEKALNKYWDKGFVSCSACNQARIYYTLKYAFKNAVVKPDGLHEKSDKCFTMCSKNLGLNFLTPEMRSMMEEQLKVHVHLNGFLRTIPKYYRDKVFSEYDKEQIKMRIWEKFDPFARCPDSELDPQLWRLNNYNSKLRKIRNKLNKEKM